ncbi:LAETG motif-containing sortase-dependent surface protein [Streptomyces sp. ICBB 8177]|uniref:LAETG motif-containing sortase-dependent surface protein n=1 Tax=Streptomyces sp. ICBB 8177 TaxID=563922 RepID=UPI000D67FCEA|nr:LAETG motif-containing sortase-dependent surface protein [Streptomyces sp. ICBB 8177]PWI43828.1 hypothetical protein CK485_17235 [Streptomyces sp. ICBB 8177]
MATRRSLTTTTAVAGGLLAALCFVPSASASVEHPEHSATASAVSAGTTASTRPAGAAAAGTGRSADTVKGAAAATAAGLADTGSVDTTPYLVGGSAFLGVGAALLLYSRRRALVLL